MQALLLLFLGKPAIAAAALVMALALGWAATSRKLAGPFSSIGAERVGWRTVAVCLAISLAIFALGGEGRFFYANTDWQVRNAVLLDLARYPWPFTYVNGTRIEILRAPLGMYLLPALVGKSAGFYAAELVLLVQNSLLLGVILALASTLYENNRARWIAVCVFFGFSGMDIIGQWGAGRSVWLHLEQWAGIQFTANLTQAFWVPQHAMAGWIFAILYLLWRDRHLPAWIALAIVPLSALLSPLAMIGMLPFAAHIGIDAAVRRQLRWTDVVLPGVAVIVTCPTLLYLTAGSESVGSRPMLPNFLNYVEFIALETGFYVFALGLLRKRLRFGAATGAIVLAVLLLAPLIQVGDGVDFIMRASIPALAILALMVADIFIAPVQAGPVSETIARGSILIAFVVGLATPLGEIGRAVFWSRAPEQLCGYFGVVPNGSATYVTPFDRLPRPVRPTGATQITLHGPAICWDGPWLEAATGRDSTSNPHPD
jgi:hypothetical protein